MPSAIKEGSKWPAIPPVINMSADNHSNDLALDPMPRKAGSMPLIATPKDYLSITKTVDQTRSVLGEPALERGEAEGRETRRPLHQSWRRMLRASARTRTEGIGHEDSSRSIWGGHNSAGNT